MPSKNTNLRTIYVTFMVLYLSLCVNTVLAAKKEDMAVYQDKLTELQAGIAKIQKHLKGNKKQRSVVLTELKTLESEISKNSIKLSKLSKKLQKIYKQKNTLENELRQLNKQLLAQKSALSEQVRSAYGLGQQKTIKMLLNQQDPAKVSRTQEYFNYFNRARTQQITAFITSIEKKKHLELQLKQALNTQKVLHNEQKQKTKVIQKQRRLRKALLSELGEKIQNQEHTLTSLESSRHRIENLLKSLGELLADIPTGPSENKPFKSLKGQLPLPVKGKLLSKFGQSKHQGDLKWNGVLIKSNYGTPVHVISHGRVAFSDWLQGYGFITIVDHGNGYMSLYGNSEALLKQAGDWVNAGDIIATAGDSGGQPQSGVYFEIRSRGKPVNPLKWCNPVAVHASNKSS